MEEITLHENDRDYRKHLKKEKHCKSLLIEHIAESQLEYIKDKSMDIYDAFKSVFERIRSIDTPKTTIYSEIKLWIGDMKKHLLEFDNIIRKLKGIEAKLQDIDVIFQLLLTMPKSCNSLVTSLETR